MTASGDAFLRWAMSEERTVEERFSVLLLTETYALSYSDYSHEARRLDRQARAYNPAWTPTLRLPEVAVVAEKLEQIKLLRLQHNGDRPVRSLEVLQFFPHLEHLHGLEGVLDLEPLRHVPELKVLDMGIFSEAVDVSPLRHLRKLENLTMGGTALEDYRPVAQCPNLRVLHVYCRFPWPRMAGWEALEHLEELKWHGSALGFLEVKRLPAVRTLDLSCGSPHSSEGMLRDVGQLPEMPELRILWAQNFCHLDGVERYTKLQSAWLGGTFRTAAAVTALPELTHLRLVTDELREVKSLTKAPRLHQLIISGKRPQDYSVLAETPQLREVRAFGCATAQLDLDMLRVVLPPWDEYFLTEVPRPLGPLELIGPVGEQKEPEHPPANWPVTEVPWERNVCFTMSAWTWCMERLRAALDAAGLRHEDGFILAEYQTHWQQRETRDAYYTSLPTDSKRVLPLTLLGTPALSRLKEVVDCVRHTLATFRHPWVVFLMGNPTPDDEAWGREWVSDDSLEARMEEEREHEEQMRKEQEFLAQELRLKLLREEGIEPDAKDFGLKPPPADAGKGKGGVATASKTDDAGDDDADEDDAAAEFDEPNLDWDARDDEDDAEGGIKDADPKDEEKNEHWLKPPPHLEPNTFWEGLRLYSHLTENAFYLMEHSLEPVRYLLSREE